MLPTSKLFTYGNNNAIATRTCLSAFMSFEIPLQHDKLTMKFKTKDTLRS